MFKHLLLPADGTELSERAVEAGLELAKAIGAKVTAAHVVSYRHLSPFNFDGSVLAIDERVQKQVEECFQSMGEKCLEHVEAATKKAGIAFDRALSENDDVWKGILDMAEKKHCDLIVMTSHGRHGISAVVLGSETNKVLIHSKIPVLGYR